MAGRQVSAVDESATFVSQSVGRSVLGGAYRARRMRPLLAASLRYEDEALRS
jgi:hypothetical protein